MARQLALATEQAVPSCLPILTRSSPLKRGPDPRTTKTDVARHYPKAVESTASPHQDRAVVAISISNLNPERKTHNEHVRMGGTDGRPDYAPPRRTSRWQRGSRR